MSRNSLIFACFWIALNGRGFAQKPKPEAAKGFGERHISRLPHNAESCSACHIVPGIGGSSRVTVVHSGEHIRGRFKEDSTSGMVGTELRVKIKDSTANGLRVTPSILGDGYVEAVPDDELKAIAVRQIRETHGKIHGTCNNVTLPQSIGNAKAVGRFGWKSQHASLLSASAHALDSELGVPNYFFSKARGSTVFSRNRKTQSEKAELNELEAILAFLRSIEPIAPDIDRSNTESSRAGSRLFDKIGCAICHVRTLRTAPAGSSLDANTIIVSAELGNRDFHPYSDFLLHDVGTGDGILQNIEPQDYDETTANKFRTAPLWGVRFRSWLMHDGKSVTYHQAIMRHAGESVDVIGRYQQLTPIEKEQLRLFLDSL